MCNRRGVIGNGVFTLPRSNRRCCQTQFYVAGIHTADLLAPVTYFVRDKYMHFKKTESTYQLEQSSHMVIKRLPTIDSIPGPQCFNLKFSSANGPPNILVSPVPSPCSSTELHRECQKSSTETQCQMLTLYTKSHFYTNMPLQTLEIWVLK